MSGCVGSPTNGSENGRMVIGRGDASIGPSWAPCEVSADLSIVGAASGGSDVRGRRESIKLGSELGTARCAHSSHRSQIRVLSQLLSGWVTACEVGRRQRFCRVLKGRLSRSVGDARGMTILAG